MNTLKTQNTPVNTGVSDATTIDPAKPLENHLTTSPLATSPLPNPSTAPRIDAYSPPISHSENPQSAIRNPQLTNHPSQPSPPGSVQIDHLTAELESLRSKLRQHDEEKMLAAGDIDKLVDSRVESRLAAYRTHTENRYKESETARHSMLKELTEIKIDQAATVAGAKHGLIPSAIPDLTVRARQTFTLHNGSPVAFEPDGKTVKLGKTGTPLTLSEWTESLIADAPHLFQASVGLGSPSGMATPFYTEPNPFTKAHWNLTKQGQLYKTDRELFERLRASAKIDASRKSN